MAFPTIKKVVARGTQLSFILQMQILIKKGAFSRLELFKMVGFKRVATDGYSLHGNNKLICRVVCRTQLDAPVLILTFNACQLLQSYTS